MKKLHHTLSAAILAGAVFTSTSLPALAEEVPSLQTGEESKNMPFTDVSPTYKDAVYFMYSNDIAQGISKTQFGVNQQLKRVDAAIIIAKYLKLKPGSNKLPFTDVPQRAVPMVSAIYESKLMIGKSPKLFGSDDSIKRGEAVRILSYLLPSKTAVIKFADVSDIYASSVERLVAHGIVQGKTATRFGIEDNLTRGELALMLYRIIKRPSDNPGQIVLQ